MRRALGGRGPDRGPRRDREGGKRQREGGSEPEFAPAFLNRDDND
jgi:hypothetical protein